MDPATGHRLPPTGFVWRPPTDSVQPAPRPEPLLRGLLETSLRERLVGARRRQPDTAGGR